MAREEAGGQLRGVAGGGGGERGSATTSSLLAFPRRHGEGP